LLPYCRGLEVGFPHLFAVWSFEISCLCIFANDPMQLLACVSVLFLLIYMYRKHTTA
jgi:hypothetical protein